MDLNRLGFGSSPASQGSGDTRIEIFMILLGLKYRIMLDTYPCTLSLTTYVNKHNSSHV